MKKQKVMFQMKGQDKTPEKQLNEVETDRRIKKSHNSTVEPRTKITLQKVNQDEKAESHVPDKETRQNLRKTTK